MCKLESVAKKGLKVCKVQHDVHHFLEGVVGGGSFLKLSAKPANESAISPLRQDLLEYDASQSFTRVVDIDTGITN